MGQELQDAVPTSRATVNTAPYYSKSGLLRSACHAARDGAMPRLYQQSDSI
jgi:hypothetical protein